MEFIVLREKCLKERETFMWFLQWTGNEEELTKLHYYIQSIDQDDLDGDVSIYKMDIDHRVSLQTAEEMSKIQLWDYCGCPEILKGKFVGLEEMKLDLEHPSYLALDEVFYNNQKTYLFKNPQSYISAKDSLREQL